MQDLYFVIFGYRVYLTFFLILFCIPLLFVIILALVKLKKRREQSSLIEEILEITDREKKALIDALVQCTNVSNDECFEAQEHITLAESWDEIWELSSTIKNGLTVNLFKMATESYLEKNQNKEAFLYLYMIDYLNKGAYCLINKKDWIGEDVPEEVYTLKMEPVMKRLQYIWLNCLEDIVDNYVDEETLEIKQSFKDVPELMGLDSYVIGNAVNKVVDADDLFIDGDKEAFQVISRSIIDKINGFISATGGKLKDYQIYYIRALASTMIEGDYEEKYLEILKN